MTQTQPTPHYKNTWEEIDRINLPPRFQSLPEGTTLVLFDECQHAPEVIKNDKGEPVTVVVYLIDNKPYRISATLHNQIIDIIREHKSKEAKGDYKYHLKGVQITRTGKTKFDTKYVLGPVLRQKE